MITKEELMKRYDGKKIDELERLALSSQKGLREAHFELVCVLYYIKVTKRYKENRRYAKATFGQYIDEVFSIREGTFIEWQRAVLTYPEESKRHNIGLVAKVAKTCGPIKSKAAFAAIDEVVKNAKKDGPAVREKIDAVVESFRATPKIKREVKDYKAMYERECAAHEAAKGRIRELEAANAELVEQVKKLKRTAERFTEIRRIATANMTRAEARA
jgi:hypothetical protein